eukprot:5093071-Pleurochrysis_carterae.AAC.1
MCTWLRAAGEEEEDDVGGKVNCSEDLATVVARMLGAVFHGISPACVHRKTSGASDLDSCVASRARSTLQSGRHALRRNASFAPSLPGSPCKPVEFSAETETKEVALGTYSRVGLLKGTSPAICPALPPILVAVAELSASANCVRPGAVHGPHLAQSFCLVRAPRFCASMSSPLALLTKCPATRRTR